MHDVMEVMESVLLPLKSVVCKVLKSDLERVNEFAHKTQQKNFTFFPSVSPDERVTQVRMPVFSQVRIKCKFSVFFLVRLIFLDFLHSYKCEFSY